MPRLYLFLFILSLSITSSYAVNIVAPINLNTATVAILAHSFKGIGQKRAEAVIAYRDRHGPFKSVSDLANVKGIGHAFIVRNHSALIQTYRTQ